MSKFEKSMFNYHGGYLTYGEGADRKFVARFKRGGMASFKSFLTKNFLVEEYFTKVANSTPMEVLETKGYISPNLKRALVACGYTPDQAGRQEYFANMFGGRFA